MINKRVSALDSTKLVAEISVYLGNGKAVLDDAAKKQIDQLVEVATSLDGYMIEIAGYASSPGSAFLDPLVAFATKLATEIFTGSSVFGSAR